MMRGKRQQRLEGVALGLLPHQRDCCLLDPRLALVSVLVQGVQGIAKRHYLPYKLLLLDP